jgi:uncharacterized RDD family membrane protein YckC
MMLENIAEEDNIAKPLLVYAYAGFWRRFAACLLDWLVLSVITAVLGFGVGFVWFTLTGDDELSRNIFSAILNLAMFIISWFYFAGQESSDSQATLGKRVAGIFVTDTQGEALGFGRASARYFSKMLSSILMIGYLIMLITTKRQALHDLVAGTLVIHAHS